jgi:hypothetical protein
MAKYGKYGDVRGIKDATVNEMEVEVTRLEFISPYLRDNQGNLWPPEEIGSGVNASSGTSVGETVWHLKWVRRYPGKDKGEADRLLAEWRGSGGEQGGETKRMEWWL